MKKGFFYKYLLLFIMFIIPISAKADVSFSVTKKPDNLKPGETVAVTVKSSGVNDVDTLYGFNLKLNSTFKGFQGLSNPLKTQSTPNGLMWDN